MGSCDSGGQLYPLIGQYSNPHSRWSGKQVHQMLTIFFMESRLKVYGNVTIIVIVKRNNNFMR